MMRHFTAGILTVLLLALILPVNVQAEVKEPRIRVGLIQGQEQVRITSTGGFVVIDTDAGLPIKEGLAYETIVFASQDTGIGVGEQGVYNGPVRVLGKGEGLLQVNGNPYRGEIEVFLRQGRLTVVNELPVEEYLYGVVPREIPGNFPLEALKAQAVAARTYAYANWKKHLGEGFNLCATVDCQNYAGAAAENPMTTRAVDSTRNEVLRYDGCLIDAYYHASSGGYTENSENVWSEPVPYLRGVPDYEQDSPYASWDLSYSPDELTAILQQGGVAVGRLEGIEPLSRGVSGRVNEVRITGDRGSRVVSGNQLRAILGFNDLRSTLFDVEMQRAGENIVIQPMSRGQEVAVIGGDGQLLRASLDEVAILGGDASAAVGFGQFDREQVVFRGSGWGHGLGLSQWGAKAMAEMAPVGNSGYYRVILEHYYQGAVVEPL